MEGDNPPKFSADAFKYYSKKTVIGTLLNNPAHTFIKEVIPKLQQPDEITVLNTLFELQTELSMANDSIADDPNCQVLIKELIVLLDKFFMLPDISLSSLTCINNLLDINPRFANNVIKYGALPKIIMMTQNIEYIDIAETAIKSIEKMSLENPFALLENDAVQSVLNLIDFFDMALRKSAIRAVSNITKTINSIEYIRKFILPVFPILATLCKINGSSDIEKSIMDCAIQSIMNIVNCMKLYNMNNKNKEIFGAFLESELIDNLFHIFLIFLKDKSVSEFHSINVSNDTFRNIIKTFELLCYISDDFVDNILDKNILEITYSILSREFSQTNDDDKQKVNIKLSSSNSNLYQDFFAFLISLFPNKKQKLKHKLLSDRNNLKLQFFGEKILVLLISNILNISSTNTIVHVIKLIGTFIQYSPEVEIKRSLNSSKISNLFCKMLDSRDCSYIQEVFNTIEVIMEKVPEHFITSFIREGIIDHIENIRDMEESRFYVSTIDSFSSNYYNYGGNLQDKYYNSNYGNPLKTFSYINPNLVDEGEVYNIDDLEKMDEEGSAHEINKLIVKKSISDASTSTNTQTIFKNPKPIDYQNKDKQLVKDKLFKEIKNAQNNLKILKEKNLFYGGGKIPGKVIEDDFFDPNEELTNEIPDSSVIPKETEASTNTVEKKEITATKSLKYSYSKGPVSILKEKASKMLLTLFNEENIKKYLSVVHCASNPREIKQKLSNIKDLLKDSEKVDISIFRSLFDILFTEEGVTFYEIEKSELILYLAQYFDKFFKVNYDNTFESDYNTMTTLVNDYDDNIIKKLKIFFSSVNCDVDKISNFIKILQFCISSMNCFKMLLYDTTTLSKSNLFLSALKNQNHQLRVSFNYLPNPENQKELSNISFYKDLIDYYLQKKSMSLYLEQSETFNNIQQLLLHTKAKSSSGGVPLFSSNSFKEEYYEEIMNHLSHRKESEEDINLTEKLLQKFLERKTSIDSRKDETDAERKASYTESEGGLGSISQPLASSNSNDNLEGDVYRKLDIHFFVKINDKTIQINKNWTITEMIRELKNTCRRTDVNNFYGDMKIYFDISFNPSAPTNDLERKISDYSAIQNKIEQTSQIFENYSEEAHFISHYNKGLINNKSVYNIKRAAPFIFLISLFELCINDFGFIFNLKEKLDSAVLENLKMSSLLTKQAKDPYAISSGNLPSWCKELSQNFPYLASFNSRYLAFKTTSFDVKRSMTNLYIYQKNFLGENIVDDKTLSTNKRKKFKVDRKDILSSSEKLMKENLGYTGLLEFEYFEETGTGIGPTLEFYSLFSKEISQVKKMWYRTDDYSLFPTININEVEIEMIRPLFVLLGFIIARGIYDDRLIDFPINSVFWDIILDRPINIHKITKIDQNLGKVLIEFTDLIKQKNNLINSDNYNNIDINDHLKYNNTKIEDLGLTFVFPGYSDINLISGGSDILVTARNIERYVSLIFDFLFNRGIRAFVEAFKEGFYKVFPVESLKCFQSEELENFVCSSSIEKWEEADLVEHIHPNHGYDKNSDIFKQLIKIMHSLNDLERKAFLLFATGSPRLPLGGFKNLTPKFTVVKKTLDNPLSSSDYYLPTVMTCQNYLKIPEYSNIEIFKEKLFIAMFEGGNAFHLS